MSNENDRRISDLPAAVTPLAGNELIPVVQNGNTRKALASDLAGQPGEQGPAYNFGSGPTINRPPDPATGTLYFDTDLNKPVFYDGNFYVLADGTPA